MGVDRTVTALAGVDAREGSPSLLDRYDSGAFDERWERDPSTPTNFALQEWLDNDEHAGLTAVIGGSLYADDVDALPVFVGVRVDALDTRDDAELVSHGVTADDAKAALARARKGLTALGVHTEPRLFLVYTEA